MGNRIFDMKYEHPVHWVPCACEGYTLVPQALRECENHDVVIDNFGAAPQVVRKIIKSMAQTNEFAGIKFNSVTITDMTEPPLKSDQEAVEEMANAMGTGMTVGASAELLSSLSDDIWESVLIC